MECIFFDKDDGTRIILSKSEMERIYLIHQEICDKADLRRIGVDQMTFDEEFPPIDEEVKDELVDLAVKEYRKNLDSNDDISEIIEKTAEENIKLFWPCISSKCVRGAYGLTNTASVNVYYANEDVVWAGINAEYPEKCSVLTDDESGREYFMLGDLRVFLDEVMRI